MTIFLYLSITLVSKGNFMQGVVHYFKIAWGCIGGIQLFYRIRDEIFNCILSCFSNIIEFVDECKATLSFAMNL